MMFEELVPQNRMNSLTYLPFGGMSFLETKPEKPRCIAQDEIFIIFLVACYMLL